MNHLETWKRILRKPCESRSFIAGIQIMFGKKQHHEGFAKQSITNARGSTRSLSKEMYFKLRICIDTLVNISKSETLVASSY